MKKVGTEALLISSNNKIIYADKDTYECIENLKADIRRLTKERNDAIASLNAIKPIVEHKDYRPALSRDCCNCKFVVRSHWDGDIIGCRKENVCNDFKSVEEYD